MDLDYQYNPALLDSTRDMDLSYSYNPALLDSTRDMDLSYSYNPEEDAGSYATGVWEHPTDVWSQPTEILTDEAIDYASIKQVLLDADWEQVARILGGPQMAFMKRRALMKVLQNDPNVDLALRRFIDAVHSASEDVIMFG